METNGYNLKPYTCRKCGSEQARTDGERLYFGELLVPGEPLSVLFTCSQCFAQLLWRCKDYDERVKRKLERVGRFVRK